MNIFIDLDGTLYDTKDVQKGNTLAHILIAEAKAPLFENSKSTIEGFCRKKANCFVVTSRGMLDDEEVQITKQRLKNDGFLNRDIDQSLFKGAVFYSERKIDAIRLIYEKLFNSEIGKDNTIFIDNDIAQIEDVAFCGVKTILFAKDIAGFKEETKNTLDELKVNIAYSWQDIEKIANNIINRQDPEKI